MCVGMQLKVQLMQRKYDSCKFVNSKPHVAGTNGGAPTKEFIPKSYNHLKVSHVRSEIMKAT